MDYPRHPVPRRSQSLDQTQTRRSTITPLCLTTDPSSDAGKYTFKPFSPSGLSPPILLPICLTFICRPLAAYLGKKRGEENKYWKIYGSYIYEEAFATSVGWYRHELDELLAVTEARQRYIEGTYSHPTHYYIHADIPPRRLTPIPVHKILPWDTPLSSLPRDTPPIHPWSVPEEIGSEGPAAESLDDDWAPIVLEGLRSVKIEESSDPRGSGLSRQKTLDDTIKHVMREFYSFTDEDFRKIDSVLANPRLHTKLEPALVSGGVEESKAGFVSRWMLGALPTFSAGAPSHSGR